MYAILLALFSLPALPPQAPSDDLPPQAPVETVAGVSPVCGVCTSISQCGCLSGDPCPCRKYGSYKEWKDTACVNTKARAARKPGLMPRPVAVLPGWGTAPAFPTMPFGGTFSSSSAACRGGG